jgi:release factor glutamine methyltransferase
VGDLLRWTEEHFRRLDLPSPRLDAELLLAHALGASRLELYTEFHKLVEPDERARFRSYVERRRRHEPVAYIVGRREFFSLSFEVTPDVLVPRPESEHLVEALLEVDLSSARGRGPRILDIGTGCGNLAVAIALNLPAAAVHAVEVSAAAVEVARRNVATHGVEERVEVFHGSCFAALPAASGRYDAVVSNPPYISEAEYRSLMDDVLRHEPRVALVDTASEGGDGLGFYRLFAREARERLEPAGALVVEVGLGQSGPAAEIFAASGWTLERVVKDHGGIERVLVLRAG